MKLSKDAEAILAMCWRDEQPRATSFIIGEKHSTTSWHGVEFNATDDTYEELMKYKEITEKPFNMIRTGKMVSISGRKSIK